MLKCPECDLINPSTALTCDCGYQFTSQGWSTPSAAIPSPPPRPHVSGPSTPSLPPRPHVPGPSTKSLILELGVVYGLIALVVLGFPMFLLITNGWIGIKA